jgi:hypothetical protein
MKRKTDKQEQKSMELWVLKYFLMAAREENITRTAKLLHITQPTLSRQLMRPDLAQKRSTVRDRKKIPGCILRKKNMI